MPVLELVRCACEHCQCSVESTQGFTFEGKLYCSESCANHDHEHPSACCEHSHCCH